MSAIWGVVDFSQKNIVSNYKSIFEQQYQSYAIDHMDSSTVSNAYFGCGHQFLTPTASQEQLPIHDTDTTILFTCDGVLDNREELLIHFPELSSQTPDGMLIYQAYLKWGVQVCDHLLGAFAFVVYHFNTNQCYLFTDHMGNRSLFYFFKDNVLYFSTLIVPLQRITECDLSKKWLTSCLSNTSANIAIFEGLTPFENIYQCPASTYTLFTTNKREELNYWSPLTIKPDLHLASDEEYKNLFIDTLRTCVESQLRTTGNIGATLSGGLDSTTIASFAANSLRATNQVLHSYTSVPLEDYKSDANGHSITNESAKVLDFCKLYPNIKPSFLSCPGKDGFSSIPELIPLLGYPMKSAHNLTWLNEIYSTAHGNRCTLMLKGQYGNSTISYGPALTVFYQLLLTGKWKTMFQCIRSFQKHYHVPLKNIGIYMCKEWLEKLKFPSFNYADALAPKSQLKEHHILSAIKQMQHLSGTGTMDSRSQRLHFLYDRNSLGQLGMFDTAMGLIHGLIIRDPSKDKRIVELCARIPVKYYIAGGLERGLIRTFMQGYIPNSILLDIHHRGLQSADNHYRIIKNWAIYREEMLGILDSNLLTNYVDNNILLDLKNEIHRTSDLSPYSTRKLNILYSIAHFIKQFERTYENE